MSVDTGEYYIPGESDRAASTMAGFDPEKKLQQIGRRKFRAFFEGVRSIYQIIDNQEDPKIILAPWRGSAPIVWALQSIAEHKGKELPIIVPLPIGTSVTAEDASSWNQKGRTGQEKIEVTRSYLNTIDTLYGPILNSKDGTLNGRKGGIVLLDEANTGGTISQAAAHISLIIDKELKWNCKFSIVMAHTNHGQQVSLAKRAESLLSNYYGATHKVTMPLFFMDMQEVLPFILRQDPNIRTDAKYSQWELLEVTDNPKAREAIQSRCKIILAAEE